MNVSFWECPLNIHFSPSTLQNKPSYLPTLSNKFEWLRFPCNQTEIILLISLNHPIKPNFDLPQLSNQTKCLFLIAPTNKLNQTIIFFSSSNLQLNQTFIIYRISWMLLWQHYMLRLHISFVVLYPMSIKQPVGGLLMSARMARLAK